MKFALFGHARGVSSPSVERHLLASLQALGDEVVSELTPDVDMVISLGGDGTFLRSAEKVGSAGIPIVGVNTGHLGFLADVSPEEVDAFLACIHQGQYEVRSRSVLQAEVVSPRPSLQSRMLYALNEVAVTKHDSASMISIQVASSSAPLRAQPPIRSVPADPSSILSLMSCSSRPWLLTALTCAPSSSLTTR